MKYTSNSVTTEKEIFKRKLGAEYTKPITVTFGSGVTEIKAGNALTSAGAVTTGSDAVGILVNDVTTDNPNGTILCAFGVVNTANCPDSAISEDVKTALPLIIFE